MLRNTLRYNVKVYADRMDSSSKRYEKGVEVKLLIEVPQQNFTLDDSKQEKAGSVSWKDWEGHDQTGPYYFKENDDLAYLIPPQAQYLSVKMTSSDTAPFLNKDNAGEYVVANLYLRVLRGLLEQSTLASKRIQPDFNPLPEDLPDYFTAEEITCLRYIARLPDECALTRQWAQHALNVGMGNGFFGPRGRDEFIARFNLLDESLSQEERLEAEQALRGFASIFGNKARWLELIRKTEARSNKSVPGALGLWDFFSFSRDWSLSQRGWAEGRWTGVLYLLWMAGAMAFGFIPMAPPGLDPVALLAISLASLVNPSFGFVIAFSALSVALHRITGVKLFLAGPPDKKWSTVLVASFKSLSGLAGGPFIAFGVSVAAMGGAIGLPWMVLGVVAGVLVVRYGIEFGAEAHRKVNARVEEKNLTGGTRRKSDTVSPSGVSVQVPNPRRRFLTLLMVVALLVPNVARASNLLEVAPVVDQDRFLSRLAEQNPLNRQIVNLLKKQQDSLHFIFKIGEWKELMNTRMGGKIFRGFVDPQRRDLYVYVNAHTTKTVASTVRHEAVHKFQLNEDRMDATLSKLREYIAVTKDDRLRKSFLDMTSIFNNRYENAKRDFSTTNPWWGTSHRETRVLTSEELKKMEWHLNTTLTANGNDEFLAWTYDALCEPLTSPSFNSSATDEEQRLFAEYGSGRKTKNGTSLDSATNTFVSRINHHPELRNILADHYNEEGLPLPKMLAGKKGQDSPRKAGSKNISVPGALGGWDYFQFSKEWSLSQRGWAEGWGTGTMYLVWMAGAMAFGFIPLAPPGLDVGSLLGFTLASLVNPSLAFGVAFWVLSMTLHRLSGVKFRISESPIKEWSTVLVASFKSLSGLAGGPFIAFGVSVAAMGGAIGLPWMVLGVVAGVLVVRYGIEFGAEAHRKVSARVEAKNLAREAVRQELVQQLKETLLGGSAEAMWFTPPSKNRVPSLIEQIKTGSMVGAIKQLSSIGRMKEVFVMLAGQLRNGDSVFVKTVFERAGKNWANQSNGPLNLGAHDFKEWTQNSHLTDFFKAAIQAAIRSNRSVTIAAHEGDRTGILSQWGVDANQVAFTSVGIEGSILNARAFMAGKAGSLLVADMKNVINFNGIDVTSYALFSAAITEELRRMARVLQNA